MRVAAGLLFQNGLVLIGRRRSGLPYPGYWEFPGGKIEEGESSQECVEREFFEELSIRVAAGDLVARHTHQYPNGPVEIYLHAASLLSGELKPCDHDDLKWVAASELPTFKLLEGNLSVLPQITEYLRREKL